MCKTCAAHAKKADKPAKKPVPRRNKPAIYTVSFFPMYIVWNGRARLLRYEEVLIELDKGKFTGAG